MKKIITTIALGIFLNAPLGVKANETTNKQSATGFFIGGHLGYNHLNTKMDMTSNISSALPEVLPGDGPFPVSTPDAHKSSVRHHGLIAGLSTGYLWSINNFFFTGVDIEANVDTIDVSKKIELNAQDYEYKFRRLFNIIPSFLIGINANETLRFFLKLGFTLSEFKYILRNNTDDIERVRKSFDIGLAPSIGCDLKINNHFVFTTTATYEMYRKNKITFIGTVDPVLSSDNDILLIRPNNFSLKFGIKYFL